MHLRGVPGGGDGLAGSDQLEGILGEVGGGDAETKTVEGDRAGWELLVVLGQSRGLMPNVHGIRVSVLGERRSESGKLTGRKDLSLLNSSIVEDGTSLEDLKRLLARVGDAGLDVGVADDLDLDVEGTTALSQVNADGGSHGGNEGETGEELHYCEEGDEVRTKLSGEHC